MNDARRFPILQRTNAEIEHGAPRSVPWGLVEPHERRALCNHSHRGPKRDDVDGSGQGDTRCYSAWVWYREDCDGRPDGRGWTTRNLPLLPARDRRWIITPGTEETP